jgi:hypothetical protein
MGGEEAEAEALSRCLLGRKKRHGKKGSFLKIRGSCTYYLLIRMG